MGVARGEEEGGTCASNRPGCLSSMSASIRSMSLSLCTPSKRIHARSLHVDSVTRKNSSDLPPADSSRSPQLTADERRSSCRRFSLRIDRPRAMTHCEDAAAGVLSSGRWRRGEGRSGSSGPTARYIVRDFWTVRASTCSIQRRASVLYSRKSTGPGSVTRGGLSRG